MTEQRVAVGIFAVCFAALIGTACGDDKPADQNVGEQGGSSGSAGSSGGTDNGVGGSDNTAGTSGSGGSNSGGSSGTAGSAGSAGTTGAGNPDDVVHASCDWEFRCCDAGERAYRLSPFATDADTCASRLIFQMRESNATANPYVSGSAAPGGLLGTLGYVVNLSRVEVSAAGVQACKEALDARGCATEPDPNARCAGPPAADPCALTNLFKPTLAIGAECTFALTEGGYNDVECVVGSTCLDAGHPDNPNPNVPTCVKRGLESEPCTLDADCDFNFFCSASGSCTEKGDANEVCSFNTPASPAPGDENVQCKFGLSCNPVSLQCVPSCTLGSTCATGGLDADLACPAGSGCAPVEVDEGTTAFRVCTALGNSAAALCNSDADCVATSYCDGTVCQTDKAIGVACTLQNQCAAGLHCDTINTGNCASNLAALTPCTESFQCGPTSAGCLNQGVNDGFACRSSKLANTNECGEDAACASGRCELATNIATVTTCVAGAALNADCDGDTANGDALRCRPGLLCFGGSCVQQASPGTDCNNPDADADVNMCANASGCVPQQWELDLCSDAAVAKTNGGTGLTCDGS